MKPTKELLIAIEHVKSFYPTLDVVIFNRQGLWLYMDENLEAFNFDERIDVSILEDASDSLPFNKPFIFQIS